MVERTNPQVWDILEEVIKGRPVLLNRAPTLHRLGIQAFMPVLVEGSAIQLHPLVCAAFNADFDGDQMAVHVPLSREAVQEARNVMLSVNNMLSPSSGEPLVAPTYEIVLGCYYLTLIKEGAKGTGERFRDLADVMMAFDAGLLELQSEIKIRDLSQPDGWMQTSPGRIIFNEVLPESLRRYNMVMDKKALKELVTETYHTAGNAVTANVLDSLKTMGFHYSTISGTTIGITDIKVPEEKAAMVAEADKKVEALQEQYEIGLITDRERESRTIAVWQGVNNAMDAVLQKHLPDFGGIYVMAHSGARGNEAQIKQMAAMRGLMSNPRGDIIELPIKSSFREGLTVLEYFISTHGARKGLADTALRTADSGYLTRRLIDVAQEVIVLEEDCGTDRGITIFADASEEDVMIAPLHERIVGRIVAEVVAHPETGEILIDNHETIQAADAMAIELAGIKIISVRSPLTCIAPRGICRVCYGRSPASGKIANIGDAVGIIAAQSIGEPGTQLTMRTFHTGGVAGKDITSGLPRVEELFEARTPKGRARLAEIDGDVLIFENGELVGDFKAEEDSVQVLVPPISTAPVVRIVSRIPFTDSYAVPETHKLVARKGGRIHAGEPIATARAAAVKAAPKDTKDTLPDLTDLLARVSGVIRQVDGGIEIDSAEIEVRDHVVDATDQRLLHTGDSVVAGQKLTSGVKDPHDLLRIEGVDATRRYLVEQVQTVYRNQGVSINDKHIETIIRQILKWVRVETIGDTDMLPNQLVERVRFQSLNAKVMSEGGEPATSNPEILGVTRASLNTDSFLAKASFQETARVLTEAAILGETDYLRGLKENVIIGRLIPARLDLSPEGRELLGITEAQALAVAGEAPEPQDLTNLMMDYPGAEVPIGEDYEGHDHMKLDILGDDEDDDDDRLEGDDGEDDLADEPLAVAPEANVAEAETDEEDDADEDADEPSLDAVLKEEEDAAGDDEEPESGV
jgi:DNA-directed RNA polymerase subunit beta'